MMTRDREAELWSKGALTADEAKELWESFNETRGALDVLWTCLDRKLTRAADVYTTYERRSDALAKSHVRDALTEMHLLKGIAFACGSKVLTALRRVVVTPLK